MLLLHIYPEETIAGKDTCTSYIYTMEYYSAIKRNTFESLLMR